MQAVRLRGNSRLSIGVCAISKFLCISSGSSGCVSRARQRKHGDRTACGFRGHIPNLLLKTRDFSLSTPSLARREINCELDTSRDIIEQQNDFSQQVMANEITQELAGQRLDKLLTSELPQMSRAKVQSLIKEGNVIVNGSPETRSRYCVKQGDRVGYQLPPPMPIEAQPEDIPLEVVYEDEHLLVINKQAHLVVHPAAGNQTGTLVNAILHHCQLPAMRFVAGNQGPISLTGGANDAQPDADVTDVNYDDDSVSFGEVLGGMPRSGPAHVIRPGIVHRLDKGTSGLMVVAKDDFAHAGLCDQFASRTVQRTYISVTCRVPEPRSGRIEASIGRHPVHRKRMAVVPVGSGGQHARHAASKYLVREELAGGGAALVEWRLETGRTHQIRVHAQHIKHPLFGDDTYGGGPGVAADLVGRKGDLSASQIRRTSEKLGRPALHALTLGFVHPWTKEELQFQAPPPDDFRDMVQILRGPG